MTTLTATAVITAVDRASAVFARVGAAARASGGRFASAVGGVNRFGQAAASNLGLPAALIAGISGRAEYEVDKMSRLMQSAGELSDQQREMLKRTAFEVSTRTGQAAVDVMKGQRELILGGLDAETASMTSELIAKVSRANDIAGEKVAEDAITNASALGLAMGSTQEKVESLRKTLDFMSVVPAFSPMNWDDLSTAMKYTGPVAGALNVQMKDLGAALSMLAFAGFKGEEAGTALRTILTRLIAPTRKARIELAAAGIDTSELFDIDEKKLNDKKAMLDALQKQGLMTASERPQAEKALARIDAAKFRGKTGDYTDAMHEMLVKVLGIGKGETQDREVLKTAIDNHVMRAVGDLDMEKVFTALKDMPLGGLKQMFGLQRLSQAKALVNKINEIVELPTGERISAFRALADSIGLVIEGASDRKAEATLKGFWATIDRISTAFSNMNHQIFASGFGNQIGGVIDTLASGVSHLSQTDPEKLTRIGWALTALMAAPLVGAGPAGLAALALAFTDLNKVFAGSDEMGVNGGIQARRVAPIMETVAALKSVGGELSGVFGDIGATINSIAPGLGEAFGFDPSGSALMGGLKTVNGMLETIAASIKYTRDNWPEFLGGDGGPHVPAGNDGSWQRRSEKSFQDNIIGGLARPAPMPAPQPAPRPNDHDVWNRTRGMFPSVDRMGYGAGLGQIRDQNPDAGRFRVDVQGRAEVGVTGSLDGTVKGEFTVRYEGPIGGPASVNGTGSVAGKLNRGESSMDLEGSGE